MIKMKKLITTLSMTFVIIFSSIVPALADNVENNESYSDNSMVIVVQGDGYVVETAKDNTKKVDNRLSTMVSPMSTEYYTLAANGNNTFTGTTRRDYSDGELQTSELRFNVGNEHSLVYEDWLGMKGQTYGFWSGHRPENATSITIQPSQTATASSTVTSVGLPPSVSVSNSSTSQTTTWPSVVINNNHVGSYAWDQIDFYTGGHFTNARSTGNISWLFGTTAIGQSNVVDVTITY